MYECTADGTDVYDASTESERERKRIGDEMKGFTGFSIIGRQDLSPGLVELTLQSSAGGIKMPMKLKLMPDGWKID